MRGIVSEVQNLGKHMKKFRMAEVLVVVSLQLWDLLSLLSAFLFAGLNSKLSAPCSQLLIYECHRH